MCACTYACMYVSTFCPVALITSSSSGDEQSTSASLEQQDKYVSWYSALHVRMHVMSCTVLWCNVM